MNDKELDSQAKEAETKLTDKELSEPDKTLEEKAQQVVDEVLEALAEDRNATPAPSPAWGSSTPPPPPPPPSGLTPVPVKPVGASTGYPLSTGTGSTVSVADDIATDHAILKTKSFGPQLKTLLQHSRRLAGTPYEENMRTLLAEAIIASSKFWVEHNKQTAKEKADAAKATKTTTQPIANKQPDASLDDYWGGSYGYGGYV